MAVHAFVDESSHASYHLVAAIVDPTHLVGSRTLLRSLRLPGERRLHFQSEGNARRSAILSALREIEARAWLYVGRGKAEHVRAAAMTVLALDLNRVGAARLAVESRGEPLDRADRLVIVKSLPPGSMVTYEHLLPHEEPMLWMADAVAWCYGAGSRWRPRVDPLITRVVTVEPQPSAGRR